MSKLIFVYNADSGLLNAMKDWAHKIVSPETYPCSLCALTYDNLGMRRPWREFIKVHQGTGIRSRILASR